MGVAAGAACRAAASRRDPSVHGRGAPRTAGNSGMRSGPGPHDSPRSAVLHEKNLIQNHKALGEYPLGSETPGLFETLRL